MMYVDTSVLVPYYCPEPLSALAQKVMKTHKVTVSAFVEVEFCSAMARRVRMGDLNADEAREMLACFLGHVSGGYFENVSIEGRDYRTARDWIASFATPLRTVDAVHLATAYSNGLTLVTADRALASAAENLGVKHQLIWPS